MANYPEYYPEFAAWSCIDPTYLSPMLIAAVNLWLLRGSEHPFLVNVRQDWSVLS